MKFIGKIPGLGALTCCILLSPGGLYAQNQQDQSGFQQQSVPTVDLEAQPNTYRYPTAPRRRRFTQPANSDPSVNPDPANISTTTNIPPEQAPDAQPSQPAQPAVPAIPPSTVNRPARQTHAYGSGPSFIQPSQGFIGPPAPLPLTLEQMAPSPPKIAYQNGLLSVESVNSRLIDILNGIRIKAGIQFEGSQALQDRVAGKFGPAPADEVLTSLLQGTRFDYVIIGMPENPSVVQRVILTPNLNSAATASVPGTPLVNQEAADDEDNSGDDSQTEAPEQPQTPEPVQPLGARQPTNTGNSGPKTAEQLLQELKQLQQNQQNQQNQPPAPIKRVGPQ